MWGRRVPAPGSERVAPTWTFHPLPRDLTCRFGIHRGPGERVQDPFIVHGVETHVGAHPHTAPFPGLWTWNLARGRIGSGPPESPGGPAAQVNPSARVSSLSRREGGSTRLTGPSGGRGPGIRNLMGDCAERLQTPRGPSRCLTLSSTPRVCRSPKANPSDRLRRPRSFGERYDPLGNENGRGAWGSHGRPPREPAEVVACAAVLLSPRHRLADPPLERAGRGFSCYPQAGWPSHLVRSRLRCESDRVADRPFALHSEALGRSGWNTRLVPSVWVGCHQVRRRSEGVSPSMTSPDCPPKQLRVPPPPKRRVPATRHQFTGSSKTRKCLIFFGLRCVVVEAMWMRKWCSNRRSAVSRHTLWKCESTCTQLRWCKETAIHKRRRGTLASPFTLYSSHFPLHSSSALRPHLDVPVALLARVRGEQASRRARRKPAA